MSWTDERVQMLSKLWADGLSASQIAAQLGGVTRNAVIGKVHRLGLSGRAKSSSSTVRKRTPRASTAPRQPRGNSASGSARNALAISGNSNAHTAPEMEAPEPKKLKLEQLTESTCRWPVGDPTMDDFYFCGCGIKEESVYCKYHSHIAYQQNTDRRRDRRAAQASGFR